MQAGSPLLLGCSRCRYSVKGCSRCRAPSFTGQRGRPAARPAPQQAQPEDTAALPEPGTQLGAPAPQPAQQQVAESTSSQLPAQLTAEQPAEAPSSSEESKPSRYFAAAAAQGDAEPVSHPREAASSAEAGTAAAETHGPAAAEETQANAEQEALACKEAADSAEQASEAAEATASDVSAAALSDGSLSGLSDFQSKLQEKLLQNKTSPRKRLPGGLCQQQKPQKRARLKVPKAPKGLQIQGDDPRKATWEPPPSPFGLIEEVLYQDPWRLLLACILLMKTSGRQVRKILWELLKLYPSPQALAAADVEDVAKLIYPLGLFKRAPMVIRFSREYTETEWTSPVQLHGVGQYGADAYFMFCRGQWQQVTPADKDLRKYHDWLTETGGQGTGLQRETADPEQQLQRLSEPHPS